MKKSFSNTRKFSRLKPFISFKLTAMLIITAAIPCSCVPQNYLKYMFTERISVQEAINKKAELDKSQNPAFIYSETRNLMRKRIKIEKIVVKDIIASNNIDYTFCVIVAVETDKGPIDCYVHANDLYQQEDIKTISRLEKGKTVIDVDGDFRRFFTHLDNTYTKIEIVNTKIDINEE